MRRPIRTLRQVYAMGLPVVWCVVGACSGRQVTYDLSAEDRALINQAQRSSGAAGASNVTVRSATAFGLTSEPASVTRLTSLLTSVNTEAGATYRYELIHGDVETC